MSTTNRVASREPLFAAFLFAVLVLIVLWGLPSGGIWDPWELTTADTARSLLAGESVTFTGPPLGAWLAARSFGVFGVHEWAGRLPVAFAGIGLLALALGVGRLYGDLRRGMQLATVLATTPLFLLNARLMMGAAPGFLASALVFVGAAVLAFEPPVDASKRTAVRVGALVMLVVGVVLATLASGVLLGVAPPLVAVAAAIVATLPWNARPFAPPAEASARAGYFVRAGVVGSALATGLGLLRTVALNQEGYSAWTGGVPRGQTPPTFELPIEALFHSFAPWSAVLPIALGAIMVERFGSKRADGDTADAPSSAEVSLRGFDLASLAWVGLALAAQSVHAARFGDGSFVAIFALGWMVASLVRNLEVAGARSTEGGEGESWARGLVVLLLVALLVRDFRGYPTSPVAGLSLRALTMPAEFNPAGGWAATLGAFGLAAFFAFATDLTAPPRSFAETFGLALGQARGGRLALAIGTGGLGRLASAQWKRGAGFRAWLVAIVVLVAGMVGFGLVSLAVGQAVAGADDESAFLTAFQVARACLIGGAVVAVLGIVVVSVDAGRAGAGGRGVLALVSENPPGSAQLRAALRGIVALALGIVIGGAIFTGTGANSLAIRVGHALLVVPFAIALGVGLARVAYHALTSLRGNAFLPMLGMSVVLAGWVVVRFQPMAAAQFSPREVYDTYNALAADDEPLGEYQVSGRAAAYYAREVVELHGESEAINFLARPTRVWLALPAEQLAQVDRAFRQRSGDHLFVADNQNANVLLATNQPIEGRANGNYLAGFVLDAPPPIQHPVNASFDRRIELLGYDLDLPNGETVGPGQAFTVTWYWRAVTAVPGGYQPFLHVDGYGQRLNGDHEPVDGHYPIRMWSEGDVVVDRQELRVPGNYPPGDYTFYIGLYAGENRLEVVSGPKDDANRVMAGRLRVR